MTFTITFTEAELQELETVLFCQADQVDSRIGEAGDYDVQSRLKERLIDRISLVESMRQKVKLCLKS